MKNAYVYIFTQKQNIYNQKTSFNKYSNHIGVHKIIPV